LRVGAGRIDVVRGRRKEALDLLEGDDRQAEQALACEELLVDREPNDLVGRVVREVLVSDLCERRVAHNDQLAGLVHRSSVAPSAWAADPSTLELGQQLCQTAVPMGLAEARIIELPRVMDQRGNLTFVESGRHLPFDIKRVYYLYDVPGGESRGGHAHKTLE